MNSWWEWNLRFYIKGRVQECSMTYEFKYRVVCVRALAFKSFLFSHVCAFSIAIYCKNWDNRSIGSYFLPFKSQPIQWSLWIPLAKPHRHADVTEQFFHLTQFLFSLPIVYFLHFSPQCLLNVVIFFLFLLTTFGSSYHLVVIFWVSVCRGHIIHRGSVLSCIIFFSTFYFRCGTKISLWIIQFLSNLMICSSDS